jgi:hypothetical protein
MSWHKVLQTPARGYHIAQLYTDPDFLGRAVATFIGTGLRLGEAACIIATPLHWRAIARHLEAYVNIRQAQVRGQLAVHDAHETLATLVAGGLDRDRFRTVAANMIDAAMDAGYPRIRAFGEMVDLLRDVDLEATIQLEGLWNNVLRERNVTLLCGYSMDAFDPSIYRGLLQQVSATHSHLIPVEDYARLDDAVARAYVDLFGGGEDAGALRLAFLKHYERPAAAMPDAEAAILALREFIPASADKLLERVRRHYALGAPRSS